MRARRKIFFIGLILLAGAFTAELVRSGDPQYRARELAALGRFSKYDDILREIAPRHNVDPLLVKAVIWQESKFSAHKTGGHGERGLMQVTEAAAEDWVRANRIGTFQPEDLFSPRTNIEAGTWYLANALQAWGDRDDPLPFALAEFNAGRSRVRRWSEDSPDSTAEEMRGNIDFAGTRHYVASILRRYEFYRARGW